MERSLKRRHLFELEDQTWFPVVIRDLMTDYLGHVVGLFDMHLPVVAMISRLIDSTGCDRIIDLASGGGGPWPKLGPALQSQHPELKVVLTDRYPNLRALERVRAKNPDIFDVRNEPVDARDVPEELSGIRTQFLSLHHFQEHDVRRIFENAIDGNHPIAVFEFQQRTLSNAVQFALSPIFVLILTLMIRPITLSRVLFTYLIPIVPLAIGWDGVVSVLRTYTPEELESIVRSVEGSDGYEWSFGVDRSTRVPCVYAIGKPTES